MNLNFFKKIFYPPNFLFIDPVGIEICDETIKYIEFFDKKGIFLLKKLDEIKLLPNIIKNGEILDENLLEEAFLKIKNSISTNFITVALPDEKTYIFDVKLPKEARTNLREALEFKIEENVPLKLTEILFEYEIVEENNDFITISVSVVPQKVLSQYDNLFKKVGLTPLSYEIESKMIAKSVISPDKSKNAIILNIKDHSTLIIGVINGSVRVTTSLSLGMNTIKDNLSKVGIPREELNKNDFFENDLYFENTNITETYSSLINIFSIYKDELEKFNNYINSKFPNNKTDEIIVCGSGAKLPGLLRHINQNLNVKISHANVWSNMINTKEQPPKVSFDKSLDYATPIGLYISSKNNDS